MEGSSGKNARAVTLPDHHARRWIGRLAVGGLLLLLPSRSLAHRCTGDCDGDDVVRVSELVRSVRIALAQAPLAMCFQIDADRDGGASIDELLLAVSNVFTLCGHAVPVPTVIPLATDLTVR